MKKLIVCLIVILFVTVTASSQDRFYYYKSQKIFLKANDNKIFFQFDNEIGLSYQDQFLQSNLVNLDTKKFIGNNTFVATVLDGFNMESFKNNSSIVQASKMVKYKSTNVGINNRFTVQVKENHLNDFYELTTNSNIIILDSNRYNANFFTLKVPKQSLNDALYWANFFYETGYFIFSEPDFFSENISNTNDEFFGSQWGLKNTGQFGSAGNDIKVEGAWAITKGRSDIVVAVLGVGVDLDHDDLDGNLVTGFDVTESSVDSHGDCDDEWYHETACAGIIAAVDDNQIGISGVAPNCKIMPIRMCETHAGPTGASFMVTAIDKAVSENADIISISYGGDVPSTEIDEAILRAITNGRDGLGTIVVCSAGNAKRNEPGDITTDLSFPGSNSNVICVGAMNYCNERVTWDLDDEEESCDNANSWLSRFGFELDVMAPGINIMTLDNSGAAGKNSTDVYSEFSGTSSACPFVSGIMALILSVNRCLTVSEARKILEASCDKVGPYCYSHSSSKPLGMWHTKVGYGRVNAEKAIKLAHSSEIVSFTDLTHTDAEISETQQIQIMGGCSVASQTFYGKRQILKRNITYSFRDNPSIIASANGLSGSTQNNGYSFVWVTDVTSTSATLNTCVYSIVNSVGDPIGNIPLAPAGIRFNATVFSELENDLLFQNQDVTWTTKYNSLHQIKAGNHVNTGTPFGDYIVKTPANITFRAGEEIILDEGFMTENDAEFVAYIEKFFTCPEFPMGKRTRYSSRQHRPNETQSDIFDNSQLISFIKISPNPTFDIAYISTTIPSNSKVEIELYDATGKTLKSETYFEEKNINEIKIPIDLTKYLKGVYFIQVRQGEEIENFKLIKL